MKYGLIVKEAYHATQYYALDSSASMQKVLTSGRKPWLPGPHTKYFQVPHCRTGISGWQIDGIGFWEFSSIRVLGIDLRPNGAILREMRAPCCLRRVAELQGIWPIEVFDRKP